MARLFLRKVAAALLVGISTATLAQPTEVGDSLGETSSAEEVICVGGPQWIPSLADNGAIAVDPFPASFRILFESTAPCTRWALDEQSLIGWHMAFGSERSAAAALSYLERDYRRNVPAPADFEQSVRRAWRQAIPDLRRALAVQQPEGADFSARHRFMQHSRSIRRLNLLNEYRENYLFLAEQYLRASEEFGSAVLLARAEDFLEPAIQSARFLESVEGQPPAVGLLYFNLGTYRTEDLQMRAAVLRARFTRSAEDLVRAREILSVFEGPLYREAARNAFGSGDDFCDFGNGRGNADALEAACRHDDHFPERVTNFWINRAMLDTISTSEAQDSTWLAIRLLEREELDSRSGRCCGRTSEEDLLHLLLVRADENGRRFASAIEGPEMGGAYEAWREALADLKRAERMVAPETASGRSRRIGEAWLALWARANRLEFDGPRRRWTDAPHYHRYAAYLRALIANVDAIAVGAAPAAR
jgi:hypothetical protein